MPRETEGLSLGSVALSSRTQEVCGPPGAAPPAAGPAGPCRRGDTHGKVRKKPGDAAADAHLLGRPKAVWLSSSVSDFC